MRLEFALDQPGEQFLEVFLVMLRFALGKRAPENAHNGAAFEQRQVKGNARDFAPRETNHQKTPFPGYAAQRGFRVVATYWIKDHINALARRDLLDTFAQVFAGIVDDFARAMLPAHL